MRVLKLTGIMNKLLRFPGLVDVHVHLREPGALHKEDFQTGTKAAIAGGYTQIVDMPNNNPPTTTNGQLERKFKSAAEKIWCDLGFNFGGTLESTKYFDAVKNKVFGLKVYMNKTTGTLLVDRVQDREQIFKNWKSPMPIMVHAEGKTVEAAISLAKKYKRKLHICHVTADQLGAIESAKNKGLKISCEVTPHHLFLNKGDEKKLGALAMMKPPLLTKRGQMKLWANIDKIDVIATDHAPHTLEEKYDKSSPKFGVPGLETTLSLLLQAASLQKITINQIKKMLSANPRKIFHMPMQKNTYILIDNSKKYKISQKRLFTKCAWTPFASLAGRGEVVKVVLRGKTVFKNGNFIGTPKGQITSPSI